MMDRQRTDEWPVLRFGDIAESITERIDDPSLSGLDHYVGLEHLDPDSLRISRWGVPSDVEATKLRFYPGDVIYARRRAYQRKLGVAEWDGICSAHALVLRARPETCLPDFLPHFLLSDQFHERAVGISVGSLSPTINWRTLASEQFQLPPLGEQRSIVELLDGTRDVIDGYAAAQLRADELIDRVISGHYRERVAKGVLVPLPELAELTMGRQKSPRYEAGINPYPYIRVANIGHLEMDLADLDTMDFDAREVRRYGLRPGDVLLTEGDIVSASNVGRSAVFPADGTPCCFQNTLIRLRPHAGVDPTYLMTLVEGARLSGVLAAIAGSTTVAHLGLRRLSGLEVPAIDPVEQTVLSAQVQAALRTRDVLREARLSATHLARSIRAKALDGGRHVQ